ncbi:hypothetical protein QUF80_08850 [Desulfococcaceae bacterium HSG8]|nr:hypothetical protein [Desulfococcaceae bacterium HSG8]
MANPRLCGASDLSIRTERKGAMLAGVQKLSECSERFFAYRMRRKKPLAALA